MSALGDLWDNVVIVGAAAADASNPVNWYYGTAPLTATVAERQTAERENRPVSQARIDKSTTGGLATIGQAASDTATQVEEKAKNAASFLGKYGPWILGGVGLVVLGVVALPYVSAAKGLAS